MAELLQRKVSSGRERAIAAWAERAMQKRLEQRQGFDGHQAICDWLEQKLGMEIAAL